jgi:hypothetical protein
MTVTTKTKNIFMYVCFSLVVVKSFESLFIRVLRFFPNSKLQNSKFPNVTLPNFEQKSNFRKVICSNNQISELIIVRISCFRNVKLSNLFVSETSNCRTTSSNLFEQIPAYSSNLFEQITAYWAALFSDNFALRGVFRLG